MAFSPSCDDGGDNGNNGGNGGNGQTYECYVNDHCLDNETCEDGYCVESQWPQCELKEYFDSCEDFTGTYEVVESNCTNRFKEITFETYSEDDGCGSIVNGIDKKSGEVECLGGSDYYKSNQTEGSNYTFTKCGEIVRMEWNNGKCESWLTKVSPDFFEC